MIVQTSRALRRAVPACARVVPRHLFSDIPGTEDLSEDELQKTASLYVHWPYCIRRCSYCNFNKYISRSSNNENMTKCLQKETQTLLQLSHVSCITSVFFGGGTPSLAPPSTIAAVLKCISQHAHIPHNVEVTLEVNPTPLGRSKLEDFYHAGVNRFSIGVQTLNDDDLAVLERDHSSHDALRTIEEASRLTPGRVSVDLMFGRPGQTIQSWDSELREVLQICDDHLSLYQLTVERGTQLFKQVQCGEVIVPGEEVSAEMYQRARTILHQHGFQQYEVSNFARHNAVSHHNLSYWEGKQYIGVGPGAHGRFVPLGEGGVCREARTQTLEPEVWMCEVQKRGHGTRRRIHLCQHELLEEVLVMGMRMTKGITHKHWQCFSPHVNLHHIFDSSPDVQDLRQSGKLILDERGLRCTYEGLAFLDSILPTLLLEIERIYAPKQKDSNSFYNPR
ncbi:radical S-adenosyl methionine domain-containing protein 1, mitochondrial isoform X2 [Boleophthalmus pectinirostris]|uniref:radical S-adenosyl methionine domain-containing protein 1, mitochondrial isoform X2 n=1 Tax=Boleophthalmus pectinirostris TaxID=150288 RepID=UPI00242B59A0|nr:radical S-adenosyl methionine domain-containing protein 1, mitochondrial isoform X2 [Boleophthalmus pectinirostris]